MAQLRRTIFVPRTMRATATDDRNALDAALTGFPYDERALQNAVWNFVIGRSPGTPPAAIIAQLAALCEDAEIASDSARRYRRRRVMSLCIAQCFDHLDAG